VSNAALPASARPGGGQLDAELGPVGRDGQGAQLDQGEPRLAHVLLAGPDEPRGGEPDEDHGEGSDYNFSLRGGTQGTLQRPNEAPRGRSESMHLRSTMAFSRSLSFALVGRKARKPSIATATAGSPEGQGPSSPLFSARVEIPRLNGSPIACGPERHGGHCKPDRVCELGGPLLLAPVAKMQGTGGGSLGAGFHKVKKEGRPFAACPWFKPLNSRSGSSWPSRFTISAKPPALLEGETPISLITMDIAEVFQRKDDEEMDSAEVKGQENVKCALEDRCHWRPQIRHQRVRDRRARSSRQDSGASKSCLKIAARRFGLRLPCHSA